MALEVKIIDNKYEKQLSEFFCDLKQNGDDKFFHPHPLDSIQAAKIARYSGKDLYYILTDNDKIIGYAMLRGWDEGYEIPSLGIVIHPSMRRTGLGKMFMEFLHSAARHRGSSKIRLKVDPENTRAIEMYKKLGYVFQSYEAEQLVGIAEL